MRKSGWGPAWPEEPCQYEVFNGERVIERTGDMPSLAAARTYVRRQYKSTSGLFLREVGKRKLHAVDAL